MCECNKYPFEKFPELRKLSPFAHVERTRIICPQKLNGNLGHRALLVAETSY